MSLECYFLYSLITFDVPGNQVAWCCKHTQGNTLSLYNPSDYFNDPVLTDLRLSLDNNIKHPMCNVCWTAEASGIRSWRQTEEGMIPNHIKNISNLKKNVTRIEIKLDTTCDLACIYCGPWDSTTWQRENKIHKLFNKNFETTDNSKLQTKIIQTISEIGKYNRQLEIGFVGGESFLSKHIKGGNIKKFIDAFYLTAGNDAKLTLKFVSNANTPEKIINKTIQSLAETKITYPNLSIHVALSFESTERYTEFSRFHSDWKTIQKNLDIWFSIDWVKISINTAFNALTLEDLPNFVKYIKYLHKSKNWLINISPNIVYNPVGLTPAVLPVSFNTYIDAALDELTTMQTFFIDDLDAGYDRFKVTLENMKATLGAKQDKKEELKRITDYCIQKRNIDLKQLSPAVYSYLYSS